MTTIIVKTETLDPKSMTVAEAVEYLADYCSDQDPIEVIGVQAETPEDLLYTDGDRRCMLATRVRIRYFGGAELGYRTGNLFEMVVDRAALMMEMRAKELREKFKPTPTKKTRRTLNSRRKK